MKVPRSGSGRCVSISRIAHLAEMCRAALQEYRLQPGEVTHSWSPSTIVIPQLARTHPSQPPFAPYRWRAPFRLRMLNVTRLCRTSTDYASRAPDHVHARRLINAPAVDPTST
jgi:hypothetical protein